MRIHKPQLRSARVGVGMFCAIMAVGQLRAELKSPVTLPAGRGADGIAVGDVLAQGGNELIVANRVSWDIMVFQCDQGCSDPSPRPAQTIKTNWAPAVIATADINRDSLTDLVIAHYDDYQGAGTSNSFGVCFQNPATGQLEDEVVYRLPRGRSSRAIAVGDVDSDGFAEIVVANEHRGDEVFVWAWRNASLEVVAQLGKIHGYVVSIAIGDVTGDDRNDVVLYGTRMFVLTQTAENTLMPAVDHGETGGESCGIGDINQDGLNDVVGATAFTGEIEIWHQTAGHTLSRREKRSCGAYTEDVAIADLNNDGRADVAVASRDESSLFVFYQEPNGGLGQPQVLPTPGTSWLNELAVGDLDGDGLPDLAASHWGSNRALNPQPGFVSVWYSRPAAPVAGNP